MKKGEIWLVELPSANGHEQIGIRPALVISETETNIAIVIPFTSNLQALRFPHTIELKPSTKNGLKEVSIALIFHVRAIDKKRLKRKIGEVEEKTTVEINNMLRKILQI
jgi:mRNA interferase MazF